MTLTITRARHITEYARPAFGFNLGKFADWETPYLIDRAKQARGWINTDYSPSRGDTGDLVDDGRGGTERWFFFRSGGTANTAYRGGTFRVTWDGSGSISAGGSGISNLSDSASGATFDLDGTGGNTHLVFSGIDWQNPPRNVSIIRTDLIAAHDAGEIFDPDAVSTLLTGWACHRFLDWMKGNSSGPDRRWSTRPRLSWQTWSDNSGMPLEALIALCNQTNTDPWFIIHHTADDDYIEKFAQLVRDTLNTNLTAWFEYSNEVWNWIFPQAPYVRLKAWEDWAGPQGWVYSEGFDFNDATAQATYGMSGTSWLNWQGKRSTQMAQIVRSVFGPDSRRCRIVMGAFTAVASTARLLSPEWETFEPGEYVAPHTRHDAYAITGYFGNRIARDNADGGIGDDLWSALNGTGEAAAVALIIAEAESLLNSNTLPGVAANAVHAREYGLQLVAYEANQHIDLGAASNNGALQTGGLPKTGVLEMFEAANFSSEMAALHVQMYDGLKVAGCTLIAGYTNCDRHSEVGSWGFRRWRMDNNPVWAGAEAWRDANPQWWLK